MSVVVGSCLLVVIDFIIYSQWSVSLATFAPELFSITSFSSRSYIDNSNYYSNSNRIYIPKTWQELNSQLFCSITNPDQSSKSNFVASSILNVIWSPTKKKDNNDDRTELELDKKALAYNRVIKDIYNVQFNDKCDTMFYEKWIDGIGIILDIIK